MLAILVLPVAILVLLASLLTSGSAREAVAARRLVVLARVSAVSGELASRLSDERAQAALLLLGQPDGFDAAADAVDPAVEAWRRARRHVASAPGDGDAALHRAEAQLDALAKLRAEARDGRHAALSVVVLRYQLLIAALLDVRQSLVVAGAPADVAERIRAGVALSQAAESAGQLQVGVLRAGALGALTPAAATQIAAARAGWAQSLQGWNAAALPAWRARLDQSLTGDDILAAQRLDGVVSRTAVGDRLTVPRDRWTVAQGVRQERLRLVVAATDAAVVADLEAWGRQRTASAATTGLLTGLTLTLTVLLASFVARRTVRSLVMLRQQAMLMARFGLPQAVAELAQRADVDRYDAASAARQFKVHLPVRGADEVADVTAAFNAVQTTALGLAQQQVLARNAIAVLIVDLGRRLQSQLNRLTASIDKAEAKETDPDRMQLLFVIDQLAAQMDRTNANLLLLAGVPTPVTTSEPETMHNVLLAATSRVEAYRRINVARCDELVVRPAFVAPLVQALTELLDNALSYSVEPVQLWASRVGDGAVIEVIDAGIGMTPNLLAGANQLLGGSGDDHRPLPVVRRMGLHVVARVAQQHGLAIRLEESLGGRGITAEMTLPPDVLQPGQPPQLPAFVPALQAAPRARMVPRPLDRDTQLVWPPAQPDTTASSTTTSGLPIRPSTEPTPSVPRLTLPPAPRRDRETRASALSSMQRGVLAARAGRDADLRATDFRKGERP